MVRREFLKLSGLLSIVLLMQVHPLRKAISLPAEVVSQGKHYRAHLDGKIYVSADAGKSWQLHTNFGSDFSILDLWTDLWGQVQVQLGFAGRSFILILAQEGKLWRTM